MDSLKEKSNYFCIDEINYDDWSRLWPEVNFSNLLQSWQYGDAKEASEGWSPKRLLVTNELGKEIAIAQVLIKKLPFFGGVARLNRGPLLINSKLDDPERLENFMRSLALVLKDCKHRKVRYLLVTPEIESDKSALNGIASLGLQKRSRKVPYGSARLSLEQPIEKIFQNLNGKWRNMLRKAQKMQLNIQQKDIDLTDFRKFVEYYKQMQVQKGFIGISENLLGSIFLQKGQNWKFNLFQSDYHSISGKDFAGFLISIQHGDTATYVIGHTNQYGRKTNANYLMLWHSIIAAQKQGCRWFDLGGINKNSAPGVVHFKNGLNAGGYNLIGEFSKFRFF